MDKKCLFCQKEFEAKRESAKYCSVNCRVKGNYLNRKVVIKNEWSYSDLKDIVDDMSAADLSKVCEKYGCKLRDVLDVYVASKDRPDAAYYPQAHSKPKIEKTAQQPPLGNKEKIAALRLEIAMLSKDWIGNRRRKEIEEEIKSLESGQ